MNKKYLKSLVILMAISIVLELFFFNFNALLSHTYDRNVDYKIYYDEQFSEQSDGTHVLNEEYSTIEIYDITGDIKNIYIDCDVINKTKDNAAFVEYYIKDDGYNNYYYNTVNYKLPLTNYVYNSRFHNIDGSGQVNGITLKIYNDYKCKITVNNISLNETKPIIFSVARVFIVFAILFIAVFIFKYKIGFNTSLFSLNKKQQNILNICLIVTCVLLAIFFGTINEDAAGPKPDPFYTTHYRELTDSIINGKVDIDKGPVSNIMSSLTNPYDLQERINNIDSETLWGLWDYAYYNNKFFVYFGIGPVILYFLPCKLLFNFDLFSYQANIISFIIFSISFLFLMKKIYQKYYNNISITMFVISFIFSIITSGTLILLTVASFYTVPIMFSLAFAILGISLWLYSIKNNKINKSYMILGSLSMALVISGRPQLILFALCGLIIYSGFIKDIKNNILNCILALIPFAVICVLIGYYNFIRFDSPFNFGAAYNITTNDMTKRGFSINRIGLGLFAYLFQPYKINTIFPFIQSVDLSSAYTGMITYEYTYGGLFSINPITLLPFSLLFIKNKNRKLLHSIILLLSIGLLIVLFDTQYAGILDRYFSDFSIFFIMASLLSIIIVSNNYQNNKLLTVIFGALMMFAICFSLLRVFGTSDYQSLQLYNPNLYYNLQYLFQFWL